MKYVLMGIGNELKGDDGIGNRIAREFRKAAADGWLSIPCETVPENFTSVVRKERPDLLVIVDAAEMGLSPGEFRIVPKNRLKSGIIGTHGIPLKHLVSYLEEHAGKVIFIGIQPGEMRLGGGISTGVEGGGKMLTGILKRGDFKGIKNLK